MSISSPQSAVNHARQPLAVRTKREYERWVRSFASWASTAPEAGEWGGDPLVGPFARDYVARVAFGTELGESRARVAGQLLHDARPRPAAGPA